VGRLKFIDGLRGVAAVLVMLYHLVGRTSAAGLTSRGYLGVATFFVLSGFVIAMVVGTNRISPGFLGRFALRRGIRLDIPYWVSIVVTLALGTLAVHMGVSKPGVTFPQVAAHLFYLQDILHFQAISPIYWTLCLEVQFYLALIVLLWIAQLTRAKWQGFLLVFVSLMGASVVAHMNWIDVPAGLMFPYWWAFSLGALCYWTLADRAPASYLALSCAMLLYSGGEIHGDWRLTAVVTTCLLFLAWHSKAMDKWLADRLFQFLGRISYSLYLVHPLVGWSAQSLALRYTNQWTALVVGVMASVLSAWVAYRFVERPSIRLSHRVSLGSRIPLPKEQIRHHSAVPERETR
jgi:peptidoglycan/LPS O-acetylase OafA/YrhL